MAERLMIEAERKFRRRPCFRTTRCDKCYMKINKGDWHFTRRKRGLFKGKGMPWDKTEPLVKVEDTVLCEDCVPLDKIVKKDRFKGETWWIKESSFHYEVFNSTGEGSVFDTMIEKDNRWDFYRCERLVYSLRKDESHIRRIDHWRKEINSELWVLEEEEEIGDGEIWLEKALKETFSSRKEN